MPLIGTILKDIRKSIGLSYINFYDILLRQATTEVAFIEFDLMYNSLPLLEDTQMSPHFYASKTEWKWFFKSIYSLDKTHPLIYEFFEIYDKYTIGEYNYCSISISLQQNLIPDVLIHMDNRVDFLKLSKNKKVISISNIYKFRDILLKNRQKNIHALTNINTLLLNYFYYHSYKQTILTNKVRVTYE